ncbi:MAG: hypothetical protein ACM3N5_06645 [Candidatus Eiseniibacteriota bacterium]
MHNLIYVSVATIAILTGGVIIRPSPSATVSESLTTGDTIDVDVLQRSIDVKALPRQDFDDLT